MLAQLDVDLHDTGAEGHGSKASVDSAGVVREAATKTPRGTEKVLQSGLVPFDFLNPSVDRQPGNWFISSWDHLTLPDAIGNVFLYVPLGLFIHAVLRRMRMGGPAACVLTLVVGAVLSGSIEWIQAYSPSRVSSTIDWCANLLGTALGTLIGVSAMRLIPRIVGAALYEFSKHPRMALLKTYCLALVIVAALPFSFAVDSSRLKRRG